MMKKIFCAAVLLTASLTGLQAQDGNLLKTSSGVPYRILSGGNRDSLPAAGVLKFHVLQRVNDSVLFSSYQEGVPQFLPVAQLSRSKSTRYTDLESNFFEILAQTHKGDSVFVSFLADSFLTSPSPMPLPFKKGDQIVTTLKVLDVLPDEAAFRTEFDQINARRMQKQKEEGERLRKSEDSLITAYIAAKGLKLQKTPSGLYYQVLREGIGPKAVNGQQVTVGYLGTHLDGTKFDEGEYPLTLGSGGAIQGFEEAARLLNKGRRIRVLIPSALGYGERGQGPIKPYETLVFEMEALAITGDPKRTAPAKAQSKPGTKPATKTPAKAPAKKPAAPAKKKA